MIITNAKLFISGEFRPGSLTIENGLISHIGSADAPGDIDAGGALLTPGFIDIHTHGALGEDASDGDGQGLTRMSRHYAACGVTSFLPTTMTLPEDRLSRAMRAVRDFERPHGGAKAVGVHIEGPFLSFGKRGAQNADFLHKPDYELFLRLNDESGGRIRLVTVAPEEDEGFAFIKKASKHCTVSLGHSSADYDLAMEAFASGASHVTHLFNAMLPFSHRAPGLVGAAMDSGASAELICDGVHIHDSVIRAAHKLFGERLVIVSDSLRCAGMPDGEYELGGQPVTLKNGRATLPDGTIAGSASNLLEELKLVVRCGIPLENALTALTAAPARAIGLEGEIGGIFAGARADLLLLGADLSLKQVFIEGQKQV